MFGALDNRVAQRSLTLTLSRHRDVPLAHGNWDNGREIRIVGARGNLTSNPFPCGKGNNRFEESERISNLTP